MIADRHHRDDLAPVEEQGERPLHDDGGVDRLTLVVDAGDGAGQPRIIGLRTDGEFLHEPMMGRAASAARRQFPCFKISRGIEASPMTELKSLYDTDFHAWSQQQAEALRAATRDGSNQRLDLGNLAEEIEDLGKSVRRELQSQIRRIVRHLVKLEHSPAVEPRREWAEIDSRREGRDRETCWRQVQA